MIVGAIKADTGEASVRVEVWSPAHGVRQVVRTRVDTGADHTTG